MINPKELRLGNIFIDNKTNELLTVCKIDEDDIGFAVIDRSKYPLPNGWQAEPIPLTPEWLERCGFDQIESIQHNQYEAEERYTIRIDETNISYGFVAETYGGYPEKRTRFKFSNETIDTHKGVHFVHQLQNLFFALTGEELTINHVNLQTTS